MWISVPFQGMIDVKSREGHSFAILSHYISHSCILIVCFDGDRRCSRSGSASTRSRLSSARGSRRRNRCSPACAWSTWMTSPRSSSKCASWRSVKHSLMTQQRVGLWAFWFASVLVFKKIVCLLTINLPGNVACLENNWKYIYIYHLLVKQVANASKEWNKTYLSLAKMTVKSSIREKRFLRQ